MSVTSLLQQKKKSDSSTSALQYFLFSFSPDIIGLYAFTCAGITVVGEEVTEWSFCLRDAAGTGSPLTANISEGSLHSAARIGSRLREACTDSSAELIGRGRFLAFWCVKSMMSVSSITTQTLRLADRTRWAFSNAPAKCGEAWKAAERTPGEERRRGCHTEQLLCNGWEKSKPPTTLAL